MKWFRVIFRHVDRRAVLGALFCVAISLGVYFAVLTGVERQIDSRLMHDLDRIERSITNRLESYSDLLYHTRAAIYSGGEPSAEFFRNMLDHAEISQRHRGLRSIGYVQIFKREDKARVTRDLKKIYPHARLWPSSNAPIFASLMVHEPMDSSTRQFLGINALSYQDRIPLIEKAFATGRPVMIGPIKNPLSWNSRVYHIILSLTPNVVDPVVLKPGMKWLQVTFRIQDFFHEAFGMPSLRLEKADWTLFSAPRSSGSEQRVYTRFNLPQNVRLADRKVTRRFRIFDHDFRIQFEPTRNYLTTVERYFPPLAGVSTFIIALSVFASLQLGRRRLAAETQRKESLEADQELINLQAKNLELLSRFSRSVAEELNEESLLAHFLSIIREADIDFGYLYVSSSSAHSSLRLHSWAGVGNISLIPDQITHNFLKQVMCNRLMLTKEQQIMGPSLNRLLGPFHKAEDWIVAVIPSRQRTDQFLFVAGNHKTKFTKLQKELLDNTISHLGLGIDKIVLIETAQTSSRSKSAFLANMSHEIRTPLNALMGFSEMLAGKQIPESRRLSIANSIRKNSEYLTRLIDDVLDLSKIEAGKLQIHHRRVRLSALLDEINSIVEMRANEKDLRFEIIPTGQLPSHIFVDDVRLKQILLNIIGNAIKFTNNGSVTMAVSCQRQNENSGDLIFYVEDTGVGISEEAQLHLFKPFSQGDETTTRKFGGSGLGLALSSRLATELGGSLRLIRSIKDVGTVFEIVIPTGDLRGCQWSDKLDLKPHPTVELNLRHDINLDGARVLLVEDSEDNQEIFSFFLRTAGAEVTVVSNGIDAIKEGATGKYDLILMDIQIPGVDGKEATRQLRAQGCMTTIVALTAHAMREEKESCLQAGCDGQITKPISEKAFIEMVAMYLGQQRKILPGPNVPHEIQEGTVN